MNSFLHEHVNVNSLCIVLFIISYLAAFTGSIHAKSAKLFFINMFLVVFSGISLGYLLTVA